jgi:hypothetical protein
MANQNLGDARKSKNNEFYTHYADIEKEMNAYLEFNPDQFEILGHSGDLAGSMAEVAPKGSYQQGGPRFYVSNGDGTYRRLFARLVVRQRQGASSGK